MTQSDHSHHADPDSIRFVRSARGYAGPSPVQLVVLRAIAAFIDERGYSPTFRELGELLGIRSSNGIADHVRRLSSKGYLTFEPMKSRTMRLTESGKGLVPGLAPPSGILDDNDPIDLLAQSEEP